MWERGLKRHLILAASKAKTEDIGPGLNLLLGTDFFSFKKCWREPTYFFKLTVCDLDDEIQSVPKYKLPCH